MARLFDEASSRFSNRFEGLLALVSVLTEFGFNDSNGGYAQFGTSGFRDIFSQPGSNQVRHFTGAFGAAFAGVVAGMPAGPIGSAGGLLGEQAAAIFRDLYQSWDRGQFEGADIALDQAAAPIAASAVAVGLGSIGDIIRNTLCERD